MGKVLVIICKSTLCHQNRNEMVFFTGCYILYMFSHASIICCDITYIMQYYNHYFSVDATKETGRKGRLINHSKLEANAKAKVIEVNNKPELWLIACKDIMPGQEILFNYDDTRRAVIESLPWLKN